MMGLSKEVKFKLKPKGSRKVDHVKGGHGWEQQYPRQRA